MEAACLSRDCRPSWGFAPFRIWTPLEAAAVPGLWFHRGCWRARLQNHLGTADNPTGVWRPVASARRNEPDTRRRLVFKDHPQPLPTALNRVALMQRQCPENGPRRSTRVFHGLFTKCPDPALEGEAVNKLLHKIVFSGTVENTRRRKCAGSSQESGIARTPGAGTRFTPWRGGRACGARNH